MPTNPPAPEPEPTRTQRVAATVSRFGGRHAEAVTFGLGVLLGAAISLISQIP